MNIEDYEFNGDIYPPNVLNANQTAVVLETKGKWLALDKSDVIALAKHFELTAHDMTVQSLKRCKSTLTRLTKITGMNV